MSRLWPISFVGLIALAGNTEAQRSAPWLQWMVLGPLYASASALGFLLLRQVARMERTQGGEPDPAGTYEGRLAQW